MRMGVCYAPACRDVGAVVLGKNKNVWLRLDEGGAQTRWVTQPRGKYICLLFVSIGRLSCVRN